MRWSGLIGCAVAGALATYVGDANAADHAPLHGVKWIVDVSGERDGGCTTERASFGHEVGLACAAMGTCQVVDDPGRAELRATLLCPSRDQWTLELRTVEGALVSTTDLVGARDDRLREAAMEVARDQAPERTLAAASLRDTLGEGDKIAKPWKPPPLSLAIAGVGSVGGVERTSAGARALVGIGMVSNARFTVGATGLMGGSGANASRHFRGGLGFAFGAPFEASFVGALLEGGVDVSQSYETNTGLRTLTANTHGGAYGQGSFVVAIPLRSIRPYIAFTGGAYSEPRATFYGSADAGLAVPIF